MKTKIPMIGLGTYQLKGDFCTEIVLKAYEIGYRHFDTAHVYDNHSAIAKALKHLPRHEIFLTSKIDPSLQLSHDEKSVDKAVQQMLDELQTEYVDLLLLHAPKRDLPMNQLIKRMWFLKESGFTKDIGVSNFTIHHLQDLYDAGLKASYNQVEYHPYLVQKDLLEFGRKNGTELISYRSFGKGAILDEQLLKSFGAKYNKTSAQIILRWLIQQNIPVIPKASNSIHLKENIDIFDFELTNDEMNEIEKLDRQKRYANSERFDFDY